MNILIDILSGRHAGTALPQPIVSSRPRQPSVNKTCCLHPVAALAAHLLWLHLPDSGATLFHCVTCPLIAGVKKPQNQHLCWSLRPFWSQALAQLPAAIARKVVEFVLVP